MSGFGGAGHLPMAHRHMVFNITCVLRDLFGQKRTSVIPAWISSFAGVSASVTSVGPRPSRGPEGLVDSQFSEYMRSEYN